jgi:para-nitrobenzyl esterase
MAGLVVRTGSGLVEGFGKGGIFRWLGIPYAEPPIGQRRFKRTAPVQPWEGIRRAAAFGPKPVQAVAGRGLLSRASAVPESEDCLFLNIWSPGADDAKRPVIVWIYGGAFSMGESSAPMYDGENLSRNGDVVFVSFNYRVGILGFYDFTCFPIARSGGLDYARFHTNAGLHDQILALTWIRENIAAFGGDPANVTIMGESAGASSVLSLMACPAAKGLFQKAICQSPAADGMYGRAHARESAAMALRVLGIDEDDLDPLFTLPSEAFGTASGRMLTEFVSFRPGSFPAGPVVGDDLLPEVPMEAIRRGAAADIPLVIGSNRDEGSMFIIPGNEWVPNTESLIHRMFQLNDPEAEGKVLSAYAGLRGRKRALALARDINFHIQTIFTADFQSVHAPVWMYRFDYAPLLSRIAGLGAAHGLEIGFVFGNLHAFPFSLALALTPKGESLELSRRMQLLWLSFARTGNLDSLGLPRWPRYDTDTRSTFIFDAMDHVENDPSRPFREAWNGVSLYRRKP